MERHSVAGNASLTAQPRCRLRATIDEAIAVDHMYASQTKHVPCARFATAPRFEPRTPTACAVHAYGPRKQTLPPISGGYIALASRLAYTYVPNKHDLACMVSHDVGAPLRSK